MNKKIFKIILAICREYRWVVLLAAGIGITRAFIANFTTVVFQRLIDRFPATHQLADLTPALAAYVTINLLNHLLIYFEGYGHAILGRGVVQWVKLRALQKIASIDYLAYQDIGTGNLIQVIENGAEAALKILTDFYLWNLVGAAQILVILYFINFYDHFLFAVVLVLFALFYLFANTIMRYLQKALEKMLANQEDFSKFSVRAFLELVVFRVNGRFKAEYERVKGISDEMVRARAKVYLLQELSYTGLAILIFLVEAVVVVQQSTKILAGTSTVGTLVALVYFIRQVFWPVIGFGQSWLGYKMNSVTYSHFNAILSLPDDPGLSRAGSLEIAEGRVAFDHVSFAYKNRAVLRDFTLSIQPGRTTAFVGTSGSGKTTLLRLLLHLVKPQAGQVQVDGQDLASVNLGSYYDQVAYIPQDPPIFDGTLHENLTFGRPVDAARLAVVIRSVGLEELVRSLPQGLETLVGERGIKLSGGERQRLAFGRVMLQDPRIVVLDEPTSSLDSVTEDAVTRCMAEYLKGRTVVIVAHRLQTVRDADQIIVLEQGQIVQNGTFDALVSTEGKFRQLWEAQAKAEVGYTDYTDEHG